GDQEPLLRLPSDSREFFETFKRTVAKNEAFAAECARRAVHDQLTALAERTHPFLEALSPVLTDPQSRQRVDEFDRREKEGGGGAVGKGQLNILCWAADPTSKEVCERFLGRYVTDNQAPLSAEAFFPLPGAEPNQTPQRFPWAARNGPGRGVETTPQRGN